MWQSYQRPALIRGRLFAGWLEPSVFGFARPAEFLKICMSACRFLAILLGHYTNYYTIEKEVSPILKAFFGLCLLDV